MVPEPVLCAVSVVKVWCQDSARVARAAHEWGPRVMWLELIAGALDGFEERVAS